MHARKEPPVIQVEDNWDEATRTLSYSYAGRLLISMVIPGEDEPSYRRDSDGTLNSIPLIEQIYVMLKEEVTADVTFYLTHEAVNMRPRRAISEQAILGQVGKPLLRTVNGLYDMTVRRRGLPTWPSMACSEMARRGRMLTASCVR